MHKKIIVKVLIAHVVILFVLLLLHFGLGSMIMMMKNHMGI